MKRVVMFFLVSVVLLGVVNNAKGGTKIDLKTTGLDKVGKNYQAVKGGVKAMIQQDIGWIQLVEVGEKYSLWIKNLNMGNVPNNPMINRVTFTLELRTPAMFGSGKLVLSKQVQFDFKQGDVLPFDNPPQLERVLDKLNNESKMSTGTAILAFIGSGGTSAAASMALKVGALLQKDYTPVQKTAGVLSGYYVIGSLYEMLKQTGDAQ